MSKAGEKLYQSTIGAVCFATLVLASAACGDSRIAGGKADGPAIFRDACARCHGPDGVPSKGMMARAGVKSLQSERVRSELSDDELRNQILRGSANKQMPAFQGALSDEQVDALIEHVRQLSHPGSAK